MCFATGSLDARVNPIGATMSSFLPSLPDLVDPVGLVVFEVHWTLDEMDNQMTPTFLWFQLSPLVTGLIQSAGWHVVLLSCLLIQLPHGTCRSSWFDRVTHLM